jgi:hypothetical protein
MTRAIVGTIVTAVALGACGTDAPTGVAADYAPSLSVQAGNPVAGSATGSGIIDLEAPGPNALRRFTVSAVGRADLTAQGQWNLVVGPNDLSVHGTVTCASFDGSSAYIGGTWDRSSLPDDFDDSITGVFIELIDNGEGLHAEPDQISSVFFTQGGPLTPRDFCEDPAPGPVMSITQGNITVR